MCEVCLRELHWAIERRHSFLELRKAVENLRHMQAAKARADAKDHEVRKLALARYLSELRRKHGRDFAVRQLTLLRQLAATWGPRSHWPSR
jgi:hypothetical protein